MADDYVTIGNTGGSQGGIAGGPKNKLPGFLQKLFGDLTNSQVQIPGQGTQYGDPSQLAQTASKSLPSADAMLGPDVMNPDVGFQRQGAPQMPSQIQTPSFAQANQVGGVPGVGSAVNPALTTRGKILATLMSGAFGALAAAGKPTVGEGFQAGYQLPYQQAAMRQQVQQGAQDIKIKQATLDDLPWVRGARIAQAKKDEADARKAGYITTRNGGVFDINRGEFVRGAEPQASPESLDQAITQAAQKAQASGRDPNADPLVKQLLGVKNTGKDQQKPDNPEQQFTDEFQRTYPGSTIQQAQRAYVQNQHVTDPTARNDTRADKSYQFNVGELNTLGKPITDRVSRLSTLQDTINQSNPQSDALIAPELLTVMAGGQGSGLRMNEAEISRIVGGRTAWESIKAAANKWQTDPRKGLSITPAQRGQIRALMQAVYGKLQQKQSILDQAQEDLINTDDPKEHRRIVAGARQKMTTIDQGQSGASGGGNPLDKFWKQ
jgi:hypothetical protein